MIADIQKSNDIPLFISVDEEGGSVARIANSKICRQLSFLPCPRLVRVGTVKSLRSRRDNRKRNQELGFNLDFAPVADVNTNAENTEIGNRSFSSDAKTVAGMVSQEVKGLQSQGVSSTLKHFQDRDSVERIHTKGM